MCGFIGMLSEQQIDKRQFDDGSRAILARGRSLDVLHKNGESYGFCRLPTDDVGNRRLDTIADGQGAVFLFNGLVTNVDELCRRYRLSKSALRSDTVCLRQGLQAHGPAFLRHCRGMFACALANSEGVLLARDTVGIKPLYYAHQDGVFAFASEIKALMPLSQPVEEVMPGEIVIYNRDTKKLSKRKFTFGAVPNPDLQQSLEAAIVAPTVRYLSQSNKRVALLLSGGLDSSVIAQTLVNHLRPEHTSRLTAFCIGKSQADDVVTARKLAKRLGLDFVHVPLPSPQSFIGRLPDIVYHVESPFARVARVALLYDELAQAIKKHNIDVVIGGEGADELFFGYHRFVDGLEPEHSAQVFDLFYREVFFNTLLQRYERIFARNLIEGRVPYLDQQVVAAARALSPHDKIRHLPDGTHISKLPLRAIAKRIGLPKYVYERPKLKMTRGASGKDNSEATDGFLEYDTRALTGLSFPELVRTLYKVFYYQKAGDSLRRTRFKTEEDVMKLARSLRNKKARSAA